jgi:hypothetical protein
MRHQIMQAATRSQGAGGRTDPELIRAAYIQGRLWGRLGVNWHDKMVNHMCHWPSVDLIMACWAGAISAAGFGQKSSPSRR